MSPRARLIAVAVLSIVNAVGSAAAAAPTRLVILTPHTTIATLHQLQSLGPAHSSWTTRLEQLGKEQLSDKRPLRSALQAYEPRALAPQFDRQLLAKRLRDDLLAFQRERGLPPTGQFDALTKIRLDQHMQDSLGLARARDVSIPGKSVAILRRSDRIGLLWQLTLADGREVHLNSLSELHAELASPAGGRPILFAPDASDDDLAKLRSSLRVTAGQSDHSVPLLVRGEPASNVSFIEADFIDHRRTAEAMSRATTFAADGFFYRQAPIVSGSGSKFTLKLWARSEAMLQRLVIALTEFAARRLSDFESTAEFGQALRDFLFDRGFASADTFIELSANEGNARQWAALVRP